MDRKNDRNRTGPNRLQPDCRLRLDWLRSGSVQVRAILYEPEPEHWSSVRPVAALEPAHQGSGSAGSVQVRTRVHLDSQINYIFFDIIYSNLWVRVKIFFFVS
jgi:hypothetical protein